MFDPALLRNTRVSVKNMLMEDGFRRRYLDAIGHRSFFSQRDKVAPDPIDLIPDQFPLSALVALGDYQLVYDQLQIQPNQILHSQVSVELAGDVYVQDELEISTVISDIYEQNATHAPLGFVVVSVIGKKKRKYLFQVTRTTAIRGGFHRSGA